MELEAPSFDWQANKELAEKAFKNRSVVLESRPVRITFDTASVCNLRCVQCNRENPGINFVEHRGDPAVANRVLETAKTLSRLSLYGLGEPLLSEAFWKIVESDDCRGIPVVDINSNGTLLSKKNVDRLLRSHLTNYNISLDGATVETFKRIRLGELNKILAGIRRLTTRRRELGRFDFKIAIHMTVMMANIHELPAMIELAIDLGVDSVWAQSLLINEDPAYDHWRISRGGWEFVYREQHPSNDQALCREMVRRADEIAAAHGFDFNCESVLRNGK
jgi:MoaA/NifB/PqqE/SkfB family radical SAM enzyme